MFARRLAPLLISLAACTGPEPEPLDDTGSPGDSGEPSFVPASLELRFSIDPDLLEGMSSRGEVPAGPFWGTLYDADDVSNIGPNEGAQGIESVEIAWVDMPTDGSPTAVLYTTGPMPVDKVVMLGFVDTDDNAEPASPDPDDKDPVTFPADNRLVVLSGQTAEAEVHFGLLNP